MSSKGYLIVVVECGGVRVFADKNLSVAEFDAEQKENPPRLVGFFGSSKRNYFIFLTSC
jgi:hypothetical protein